VDIWKSTLEDLVMDTSFWKNKKILLTGHTGFKGSWLSLWLQNMEALVIGFSKFIPTQPSLFELAKVDNKMISIKGDICDFNQIKLVLDKYEPEIIIHMAAQSLVRRSYENPVETYSTNVMGTVNLFEAIRARSKPCVVINVTSDKCYENKGNLTSFKEDDPMGGYDPYSSSKGCAELITSAFRNSFFNPSSYEEHEIAVASARAGNVIGGGDWAKDRLIPDIVRGITENRSVIIRNPNYVRPWQFVLEPLSGYLLLAKKLLEDGKKYSGAWNFGPNVEDLKSVSWIVQRFSDLWKDEIKFEMEYSEQLHEARYLSLDCTKAKTKLDWNPKTNIDTAMKFTVEWYKQYVKRKDLRKFTEEQIKQFNLL
jgi:CDP-glucose 4,6-dehydratase